MVIRRIAKYLSTISVCLVLAGFSGTAQAQEWDWTFAPYLWGSSTSLDVSVNDEQVIGGDLSFSDLLDKLDMAAQFHFEGRRDTWGFFFDFTWLDVSDDTTTSQGIPLLPAGTRLDAETTMFFVEVGGFLRPAGGEYGLDVLAGARITDVDLSIDVIRPDPLPPTTVDGSDTLTDAFVGARYSGPLGENWLYVLRGDIGGGDSDIAYNAVATLGYSFGDNGKYAALFGYRYLYMEYENSDTATVTVEPTMSGPFAGFAFRF